MLGYKYTNIKIQIAIIKQIMYSYLFNLFINSPNIFFKPILTNFSKDDFNKNSKEQYENFIKLNEDIFKEFFKVLPLNVTKYMFLAVILNKDMKTNFNSFNDEEISNLGTEELQNIFFDVFFVFLERIRNEFNINLNEISLKSTLQELDGKTSFNDIFKTSKMLQTVKNIKKPILIQGYNLYQIGLNNTNKFNLAPTILNQNEGIIKDDNLLRKLFDNSYGIHGEFFYKIKDNLDIKLRCGNSTRKNIIIFSIRNPNNIKENREILGVQEFFNWKKNEDYRNLDQFIFIRLPEIQENIKFGFKNTGIIEIKDLSKNFYTYKTSFDPKNYLGAKILNRKEILELNEKLEASGNDNGFLAIIPTKIINEKDVESINNFLQNLDSNRLMYLSGFPEEERKFKMSAIDVLKLLGLEKEKTSSRTIVYQQDPYVSFDINELFDAYFSVISTVYTIKNIKDNSFTEEKILSEIAPLSSKILEKEGKFLLNVSIVDDLQKTNEVKFLSQYKNQPLKYFIIDRKNILDIKLSLSNEEKFQKVGLIEFKPNLNKEELDDPNISFIINSGTSQFLKEAYYDRFLNILEKEEFNLIKNSLFPSDILSDNMIEKLNFGKFDYTISEDLKSLRSYKNYSDFLKYYIDIVEGLVKESTDRV